MPLDEIPSVWDADSNGSAVAELMLRFESSAACAATINPPSTERNGSFSAAVPMLCHASVPLKKETIICAESCVAESILAMPCASLGHKPKSETIPPPGMWQ